MRPTLLNACLRHTVAAASEPWTAVSFWDRTGDRRHGSSTTVLCRGTLSLAEMLDRFRERLPGLWARVTADGPIVGHPANRDPEPRFRVAVSPYRIAIPAPPPRAVGVEFVGDEVELEGASAAPAPRRAVR